MTHMDERYRFFDFNAIGKRFPPHAESLIVDTYLSDSPACSMRLFRIYHPLPGIFTACAMNTCSCCPDT